MSELGTLKSGPCRQTAVELCFRVVISGFHGSVLGELAPHTYCFFLEGMI